MKTALSSAIFATQQELDAFRAEMDALPEERKIQHCRDYWANVECFGTLTDEMMIAANNESDGAAMPYLLKRHHNTPSKRVWYHLTAILMANAGSKDRTKLQKEVDAIEGFDERIEHLIGWSKARIAQSQ